MDQFYWKTFNKFILAGMLFLVLGTHPPAQAQNLNYLHTDGNRILDSNGNPVIITGISWFGFETENFAPHGLWARSLDSFLDQIVELGFNTLRLPYSNQLLEPSSVPNGINYDLNPELKGLNGLEIMDKVIVAAGERGLKVILDRHRPDSHAQSELWYTSQFSEERWINDWVMLAERYSGDDTVIGVDLHNEPHGRAAWGSGDLATDWRLAAERAGNAILGINPNLLIIVQGVEQFQGDYYWWGGNLIGAGEYPVRLNLPDRLVYSSHTYGPGVYPQPWFSDPSFPKNMPEIWDRHWGFLQKEGIAPVIVGEFGGRSVKDDKEGIWQRALVSYLRENEISYIYWTLNPNSGDTGGILLDDWQSVDPNKEELLSSYQFPLIGAGPRGTEPTSTAPSSTEPSSTEPRGTEPAPRLSSVTPPVSGEMQVRYRTSVTAELSQESKPEFIIANNSATPVPLEDIELDYWFKDDLGQTHMFNCDWAQIGCKNVMGEFHTLSDGVFSLTIHFQPGLDPLLPGQDTGEIKVRFNRSDWSEFSQSDDYSFTLANDYVAWEKVALYLGGKLVWGSQPDFYPANSPTVTFIASLATPVPDLPTLSAMPEETRTPKKPSPGLSPTAIVSPRGNSSNPGWILWGATILFAFAAGCLIAAIRFLRKNR